MKQIPKSIIILKKVYDIIIPAGKVIEDIDKYHNFNNISKNIYTTSPTIKDILSTVGVLAWMFMIKFLLDLLGVYGEISFFLLIPLSALSHLIGDINTYARDEKLRERKFPKSRVVEIFLIQFIYLGIAFFSFRGFIGHTFLADTIASGIGWSTGSPFQTELAFYHLGLGVAAMVSIWKRDSLWIGVVYSKAIFLFGAAGVHIWDIIVNSNFSPGNAGTILYINDLLIPIVLLLLLHIHLKNRKEL